MTFCAKPAATIAALILVCFAGSFAAKPDSLKLAALRTVVDSTAGWTENTDGFHAFGVKELYELIDGGAVEYEKSGLLNGIVLELAALPNRSARIYIEDFGTPAQAQSMVANKRGTASDPKPLSDVKGTNGFYDEVIGGCVAYASSDGFYFELVMTGYDGVEEAVRDAGMFVGELAGKALR